MQNQKHGKNEYNGSKEEEVLSGRPQRIFSPLSPSTKTHPKTLLHTGLPSPLAFHCRFPSEKYPAATRCELFSFLEIQIDFPLHKQKASSSMDAMFLDEWELLPDHKSSFFVEECGNGHGGVGGKDQLLLGSKLVMVDMDHFTPVSHRAPNGCVFDEEVKKPLLLPSQDDRALVTEFKDIGVVQKELKVDQEAMSKVTEIVISDAKEEAAVIKFPDGVKGADQDEVQVLTKAAAPDHQFAGEEGEGVKKIGFSVGNIRVHGALCSFGVAAATFCIFLLGGKQQQTGQNHKIQLQMYSGDDQRIQRAMRQASRLNQTMSSASARASISFGGNYHGF